MCSLLQLNPTNFLMFQSQIVTKNTSKNDRRLLSQVMSCSNYMWRKFLESPHREHLAFNCHSIHRALAFKIPELRLVDGNYLGAVVRETDPKFTVKLQVCSHSWLVTPDDAIIDAYPVGYISANPVLVVTKGKFAPYGGNFYLPDPTVTSECCANRKVYRRTQQLIQFAQGWKYES